MAISTRSVVASWFVILLLMLFSKGWANEENYVTNLYFAIRAGSGWSIYNVDSHTYYVGEEESEIVSLAIYNSGLAHIAYDQMRYITNVFSGWQKLFSSNDFAVAGERAIALDSEQNVYIVAYDYPQSALVYLTNRSGSWQTFVIDDEASYDFYASIALDSLGNIHISYYCEGLKYATNASGSWETFLLDSGGRINHIAVDSDDKVHIAYLNQIDEMKYATNRSGDWQTFKIDSASEYADISLGVDSSGYAHIAYILPHYVLPNSQLKYATNRFGGWTIYEVASTGKSYNNCISTAVDSSDKVHIAYYHYEPTKQSSIKYATNTSGNWDIQSIDSPGGSVYVSLDLDNLDRTYVAYTSTSLVDVGDDDYDDDDDGDDYGDDDYEDKDAEGCGCF